MQTYPEMKSVIHRYGFSVEEMAVLTAGSHGARLASLHKPYGSELSMAKKDNLKWYIKEMLSGGIKGEWEIDRESFSNDALQFVYKTDTDEGEVVRLPSDMIFYPSSINKAKGNHTGVVADHSFRRTEIFMMGLSQLSDIAIQKSFARVFTKMLEIGVDLRNSGPFFKDVPLDDTDFRTAQCRSVHGYSPY